MHVNHEGYEDIDERVEKVIAEVIPDPDERTRVKKAIRNGYLIARWDEKTQSPTFIPTTKMLDSITRRNNDGLA